MNSLLRSLAAEIAPRWMQSKADPDDTPDPPEPEGKKDKRGPQPGIDPDEINEDSTPGAGALPEAEPSVEPGTG